MKFWVVRSGCLYIKPTTVFLFDSERTSVNIDSSSFSLYMFTSFLALQFISFEMYWRAHLHITASYMDPFITFVTTDSFMINTNWLFTYWATKVSHLILLKCFCLFPLSWLWISKIWLINRFHFCYVYIKR